MLVAKTESKDRLGIREKKKSKYRKVIRKIPLRLRIRGTEEETPLGSVIF